jgi:hypothetical protein
MVIYAKQISEKLVLLGIYEVYDLSSMQTKLSIAVLLKGRHSHILTQRPILMV